LGPHVFWGTWALWSPALGALFGPRAETGNQKIEKEIEESKRGAKRGARGICRFRHMVNPALVFQVAGVGMMLVISVLRYCATVHPLRPTISRRKLKVFCGLLLSLWVMQHICRYVLYGRLFIESFFDYT
jgi:hypothetical protein